MNRLSLFCDGTWIGDLMNVPAADSDAGDLLNIGLKHDGALLLEDLKDEIAESLGKDGATQIKDMDIFFIGVSVGVRLCESEEDIASRKDLSENVNGRNWVSSSLGKDDAGVLLELIRDKYESSTPYRLMEQLAFIGLQEIKEKGFQPLMVDLHHSKE
ncbi:MAG TPA: hypothetical protein EYN41_04335 [Flavobacteriales bacterium]|nr:hypothetical protein [Flavobacteriales bacterium]